MFRQNKPSQDNFSFYTERQFSQNIPYTEDNKSPYRQRHRFAARYVPLPFQIAEV